MQVLFQISNFWKTTWNATAGTRNWAISALWQSVLVPASKGFAYSQAKQQPALINKGISAKCYFFTLSICIGIEVGFFQGKMYLWCNAIRVCVTHVLWCFRSGCKYFVYGKKGVSGDKSKGCYWEYTSTAACSEGWTDDSYDFYQIKTGLV